MPTKAVIFLAGTAALLGILFQAYVSPLIEIGGLLRRVEPLNTEHCESVEELQACEKLVIHSSGVVYLACASPWSRTVWMPTLDALNATALLEKTSSDYVATYDPKSRTVTKLKVLGLTEPRGLNLHGMDVVPDEHDPTLLWIYLVNHRPPLDLSVDASQVGADSVIEIFKSRVGADSMDWVKTVSDPNIIIAPNDVLGGTTGQEFWFTNDNHVKVGLMRKVHAYLSIKSTSVGYCHVNTGCKIAADELVTSNGIVRAPNGDVWVASSHGGYITVHEQQADKTLVPTEVIRFDRPIDNLGLSSDGSIIAATIPKALQFTQESARNTSITSPAGAFKVSVNTGHGSYFGEKYKVEKIYEDDGTLGSAASTAAMYNDILYLNGLLAHRMLICKIPVVASEKE
ncbi:serum paraoxonase/arylesterase [Ceratobasidium sp. AG-I]|nr:serum paraoxonase/arylesterase [Ceratobasidium sp. AG-I]